MATNPPLKAAQKIEVISLMDNTIDFLSSSSKPEVVLLWRWTQRSQPQLPIAEHGFSVLVRVHLDGEVSTVLFDAGMSAEGVVLNAQRMGVDLTTVDWVVLSHGHYDHFGGLSSALNAIGKQNLPLITHDYMFRPRGTASASGTVRVNLPFPSPSQLASAKIINTTQPYLIANGGVCVTGEIPRVTRFEIGYPPNRVQVHGKWIPDPDILDDRALVLHLAGKGLVIISGCAHAGIVNTVRYAQKISGESKVYGVLGGFHLAGKENERRIEATIEEFRCFSPELIAPCHCTGWRAVQAFAREFPEAFAQNSVGHLYRVNGEKTCTNVKC
ncbi:MAG: MBL fold metallo-hydrolase [Candidatus Bathyarchaeota archaeon]|nr:MBL fold metallo-hydrolase [Candidatus Bathyarchaeota archaeon]